MGPREHKKMKNATKVLKMGPKSVGPPSSPSLSGDPLENQIAVDIFSS